MRNPYKPTRNLFFVFLFFSFLPTFSFGETLNKNEIYQNLRSDCPEAETLMTGHCYKALIRKAFIDFLVYEGTFTKEDIYYKFAVKFSPDLILDPAIQKKVVERIRQEALIPKPHLVMESWNYNLGDVAKASGRIIGQFTIKNKGDGILIIHGLRTSVDFISVALESDGTMSPSFGLTGSPLGWQQTLRPQSEGKIHILLDLQGYRVPLGPFIQNFWIMSNDPYHAKGSATVEGNVIMGKAEPQEQKRETASEILRNYRSGRR